MDGGAHRGPIRVAEQRGGRLATFEVTRADAGLPTAQLQDVVGGDRDHNAAALRGVLEGKPGAYRDIVILGSAAALIVAGRAESLEQGAALAADAIDSGRALEVLNRLVRIPHAAVPA